MRPNMRFTWVNSECGFDQGMSGSEFTRGCGESGQATVEAAFALPVLFVIVLLLVQPGLLLYDRMVMRAAAAEGCRLLATGAATQGDLQASCEAFIRHRLACIPQQDCFHVHEGGCSWVIELSGGEASEQASVRISTEVKPLPLFDAAATLTGAANSRGNIVITVEEHAPTQPSWAFATEVGASPATWVGAWLE